MNKYGVTVADRSGMLRWVQENPGAVAGNAAKTLGVSVRNVQRGLRFLEKSGEVHHVKHTRGKRLVFLWYPGPATEADDEDEMQNDPILTCRKIHRPVSTWRLDHPVGPRSVFDCVNLGL